MNRRYTYPVDIKEGSPANSFNEVFFFDDYNIVKSVCWCGKHDENVDCELRTHDGKDSIVELVPISYYRLGEGRQELNLERAITNNSVRIILNFEGGAAVKGSLIFTMEK